MSRRALKEAIDKGEEENGNIEFKSQLNEEIHLSSQKKNSLVAQLRHRILSGEGVAKYVIGVSDDGQINGINSEDFKETISVLKTLSSEAEAAIQNVEKWTVENERFVALVTITNKDLIETRDEHIVVGTAGHVDHGKSTLIGSLVTGEPDNGSGDIRSYLDVKPHEIERGLSADLSYAVYGFDDEGEPNRLGNPKRKSDRSSIVRDSDKVVSFVDTVGHEPWLRTTIRGLVGQKLDYGLLVVAADEGPTKTTREHLGLLLATDLPTIVTITKTDLVSDEQIQKVEREVEELLRDVNRTPLSVERHGVEAAISEISEKVVPIVRTSAVTMEGLDKLDDMFSRLDKNNNNKDKGFKMYIDRTYTVEGVGTVVTGTIKSGKISKGDELLLGPTANNNFIRTKAQSLEIHYHEVESATAGQLVSISLANISEDEVKRGMALVPREAKVNASREFEAEVMVLNHPTSITSGYEPVIHLETISEVAIMNLESENLLPGEKGNVKLKFKFNPYLISEGQRFVFREGSAKGVGTVSRVYNE